MTMSLCKLRCLWRLIGLAAVAIVLVGCSQPSAIALAPTPTLTRTPQATFTPAPVNTPTPTRPLPTPTLTPTPEPTPTVTPTRNVSISPLTGMEADPAKLMRRVLAIRVGNDPEIRPQEGLGAADVVYEEIMDGWMVTRFTALFLESDASRVRPLRSARLSGIALAPQWDAALVHTGASDGVRYRLRQAPIVDLDQFFHERPYRVLAGYDWRGRMYSSTEALHAHLDRIGRQQDRLIEGFVFDPAPPEGEPAPAVRIPYPRSSRVDWEYDAASGRYLRYVQGQPHLDALNNQQIAADNVIIFFTEHRRTDIVEDSLGTTSIDIIMTGTGRAVVVRDGVRINAEWRRTAEDRPILYWDANGEVIPFRPGKTWIQIVPLDYQIVYE